MCIHVVCMASAFQPLKEAFTTGVSITFSEYVVGSQFCPPAQAMLRPSGFLRPTAPTVA